jgi:hypothetical protein
MTDSEVKSSTLLAFAFSKSRLPHLCTVVPTVHKLMGVRCLWWCEGLNLLHRQVDLALEGYLFLYRRRSLAIEGCR